MTSPDKYRCPLMTSSVRLSCRQYTKLTGKVDLYYSRETWVSFHRNLKTQVTVGISQSGYSKVVNEGMQLVAQTYIMEKWDILWDIFIIFEIFAQINSDRVMLAMENSSRMRRKRVNTFVRITDHGGNWEPFSIYMNPLSLRDYYVATLYKSYDLNAGSKVTFQISNLISDSFQNMIFARIHLTNSLTRNIIFLCENINQINRCHEWRRY